MSIVNSLILLQATAALPATPAPTATSPEDTKRICRTINETGSRLGGKRLCLTKAEWKRMQDEARELASEYQDNQSKQVGNQ